MNVLTIIGGVVSFIGGCCTAGLIAIERRRKPDPVIQLDILNGLSSLHEGYRLQILSAALEQHHLEVAKVDQHNRPLKQVDRKIRYVGVALTLAGASLALYSGITTFNPSWASLGSGQISELVSKLRSIEPEPVGIGCAGAYCDDLATDLKSAFVKAGWPDITYNMSGGLGIDGIVGIRVDPIDPRTEAIVEAIERSTKLKIIRADDPRDPNYPPGLHIVIGTQPIR